MTFLHCSLLFFILSDKTWFCFYFTEIMKKSTIFIVFINLFPYCGKHHNSLNINLLKNYWKDYFDKENYTSFVFDLNRNSEKPRHIAIYKDVMGHIVHVIFKCSAFVPFVRHQVKNAGRKLGRRCDMCSNYEKQLQSIQGQEAETRDQVIFLAALYHCRGVHQILVCI